MFEANVNSIMQYFFSTRWGCFPFQRSMQEKVFD